MCILQLRRNFVKLQVRIALGFPKYARFVDTTTIFMCVCVVPLVVLDVAGRNHLAAAMDAVPNLIVGTNGYMHA